MAIRTGRMMGIDLALGLVVAAVAAGVLLHLGLLAAARIRLGWSLRKMHFCPHCGVVLGESGTCLNCGLLGDDPEQAGAGKETASPN